MKISGELAHLISSELVGSFDSEVTDTLFTTIAQFARDQLQEAFKNRESFIKTAETTAQTVLDEISSSETPKAKAPPIQGPEILKNFVFNLPALALCLPKSIFSSTILPLLISLFDYPVQTLQI